MDKIPPPLITNDAVVFGILMLILGFVFKTSSSNKPFWNKFYTFFPSVLACYFIPSILNTLGIISGDSQHSNLYFVASRYLLPASLVLLTLSIDIKGILNLGPKALIMFFTGTVGIIIGGPLALFVASIISPDLVGGAGPDAVWRGMTTVAGSWIGGGANQTAMKEVFNVGDNIFSAMVTVDILVGNSLLAFLLYGAGIHKRLDNWLRADTTAIEDVRRKVEAFRDKVAKIPTLADISLVVAAGFGITALAHSGSDIIAPWIAESAPMLKRYSLTSGFFWIVVIATLGGFALSFTKARELEGVGASRIGSLLLYILVATIGMKMDITAIFHKPGLFLIGIFWISIHVVLMLIVGKVIRAPFFFIAVGSQANVGGAASAPVVASAFNPALAPVGVLLAVFGYGIGTFGAWVCGLIMQAVAGG